MQIERYLHGVKRGVKLEGNDLSYYMENEVEELITELAIEHNYFPENAGINKGNGQIIKGKYGERVCISETVYDVMHAKEDATIKLKTVKIPPEFDERYFIDPIRRSSFVTWFYGKDGRYENIKIALKEINNTVLYPREIFSFNKVVGPRTAKRGFQKAPSIGIPEDYGGGVCQVATTLYNAVLKADLQVIERHEHSKPVRYVAVGNDATVAYGYYDFKFQNNTPYPLIINTSFRNYGVRVYIYGGEAK